MKAYFIIAITENFIGVEIMNHKFVISKTIIKMKIRLNRLRLQYYKNILKKYWRTHF